MTSEETPTDRVRRRMRDWLETTGMTYEQFADDIGMSRAWLEKVFSKDPDQRIDVRLEYLDAVAKAMRTTASELVRGTEDRRTLELTPSEVRIVEQLRRFPDMLEAFASIMRRIITSRNPSVLNSRERRQKKS